VLQSQAAQYFSELAGDPGHPGGALSGLRDAIEAAAQLFLTGVVCRTEENSNLTFCVSTGGGISVPGTPGFGSGACPVAFSTANSAAAAACTARRNQTEFGCNVIECVEELNRRGLTACYQATQTSIGSAIPGLNSFWRNAGAATFCALIFKADHSYTADSGGLDLCSTSDPRCTRSFVVQTLLADVRRQAPFVLQGPPPTILFPAPPLTSALPIDVNNPSKLYYLGFAVPTDTSNPITVSVPSAANLPIVSTANRDHMLEGVVDNYIFEEGGKIKVRGVGHGQNTRFALLNTIVGPKAIEKAHRVLESAVQAALPPPPPPPPPPPSSDCRQWMSGNCAASCDGSWDFEGCYEQCLYLNCGY
jgi:hypothetical protein